MNSRSPSLPKSIFKSRAFLRRALVRVSASAALTVLCANQDAQAAVRTWVGSTSADWFGTAGFDGLPVTGDSLVFGADGAAGQATTPPDTLTNLTTTTGFNIAGITFNAGAPAYKMTGNTFNLTAGITNNSNNLQTFSNTGVVPVTGSTGGTVSNATGLTANANLTWNVGTAGITLSGLQFNTVNNASATTTVNGTGGTLTIGYLGLGTNTNSRLIDNFAGTGNISVGTMAPGGSASLSSDSFSYGGTGTFTLTGGHTGGTFSDAINSGTFVLSGNEGSGLGINNAAVFTETSTGVLSGGAAFGYNSTATSTLAGANTYTGGTTVNAGTLLLDHSISGAPATNIIGGANTVLTLGNGTLSIKGNSGATNSDKFNGTTLGAATSSKMVFTQNGATSLGATLGTITRNTGAVLDITLPTAGTVTTSANNTNGVLASAATNGNAFATVNGGTAFASNTAGTIGVITPVAGTYGATANVSVSPGDAPASGLGANTLTFSGAADSVAFTGTNAITAGGILLTPSATGASAISGGTFTAGAGKELTIFNNEPTASGSLTVSSLIADNAAGASALTIAGAGTTILSGANTHSGQTTVVGGGTLNLSNALALQNSTLQLSAGTALVFDQSVSANAFTLGGLAGAPNIALANNAATPAAVALTVGGNNASTTYSGVLSGAGSLVKNGTGTLTLSQNQTYTGGLTINNGTVSAGNSLSAFGPTGTLTLGQAGSSNSVTYNTAGFNNPITVNGGTGSRTFTPNTGSSFAIGGAVTFVGGGTLTINLSSATTTLTGGATGTGNFATTGTVGKGAGIVFNTGALNMSGYLQNTNTGTGNFTVNSVVGPNVTGVIQNTATSAFVLTGANTFPGDTTITSGTVNAQNALALQNSVVVTNSAAGKLTFGTSATAGLSAATLGGLAGNGNVALNDTLTAPGAVALTIGNSNVANGSAANPNTLNPSYAGVLSNGTSANAASVTKVGGNTQTFTGANTYTGTTTVTGGTLALANTTGQALSGTTGIVVFNGGTLRLGAANQVNPAAGIAMGTGAFATPPATTGILSVAAGASQGSAATVTGGMVTGTTTFGLGALTLNNTSTLAFGGAATTLVFNGLIIGAPDGMGNDPVLTITGYSNTTAMTAGRSGAATDDRLVFQGDQASVLGDFDFGSGPGVGVSEVALDNGFFEIVGPSVPEPSTWAALLLGAVATWQYRSCSRRKVS